MEIDIDKVEDKETEIVCVSFFTLIFFSCHDTLYRAKSYFFIVIINTL